ncbi:PREDICTED: cytochrome c1-2, heme protein, mitochondrial-like [Dinoponera quadriceps]|uniref:Cytochrome c1-2, heme protein, mitochondrial-like n=1 Tax=Dinoponera quadriceps TaxID=609295 RepID=A0A6P3XQT8_DINQU|nr:PREDICTED: cytochrome c1-2, heme protein, mitochondrial-like [Dinoponera quadriceps]
MAVLLTRNRFPLRAKGGGFHRRQSGGVYTWCNVTGRTKRGGRILRTCLAALVGAGATCGSLLYLLDRSVEAMVPVPRLPNHPWESQGYLKSLDHSAVRRGWQVYTTVCYSCHSLRYVRFMDLINVSHTEDEVKDIAAEFEVQDGPDDEGNYYMRPGKTTDKIPSAFPNDEAAKAANLGMYPPDLTYIIEGKRNGKNYIFAFLTGWMDPPAGITLTELQHFNVYFPGNVTGMQQVLFDGILEYDDGTPATVSQMVKDLVEFLTWTSSQEFDERKSMFIRAMGICLILLVSNAYYYRYAWSSLRSRQIAYVPKRKY